MSMRMKELVTMLMGKMTGGVWLEADDRVGCFPSANYFKLV